MKARIHSFCLLLCFFCAVGTVSLFSDAGERSLSTPGKADPGKADNRSERGKLIADLVTRGDELAKQDKSLASWAYWFACFYDPTNIELAAKAKPGINLGEEQIGRVVSVIEKSASDAYVDWPKPTPETDIIELRILLNPKLVGNLQCGDFRPETGGGAKIFVSRPSMKLEKASEEYGESSSKHVLPKYALTIITYGRVRLLADKAGEIFAVLYNDAKENTDKR